jgi:hypothetical protein
MASSPRKCPPDNGPGQAAFRHAAAPGIHPEDVLIKFVEVAKENWSFGHGEAQYA